MSVNELIFFKIGQVRNIDVKLIDKREKQLGLLTKLHVC